MAQNSPNSPYCGADPALDAAPGVSSAAGPVGRVAARGGPAAGDAYQTRCLTPAAAAPPDAQRCAAARGELGKKPTISIVTRAPATLLSLTFPRRRCRPRAIREAVEAYTRSFML